MATKVQTSQFTLGDDGTLDTVIDCLECDARERFNFAESCETFNWEDDEDYEDADYDAFVDECLAFCVEHHECQPAR